VVVTVAPVALAALAGMARTMEAGLVVVATVEADTTVDTEVVVTEEAVKGLAEEVLVTVAVAGALGHVTDSQEGGWDMVAVAQGVVDWDWEVVEAAETDNTEGVAKAVEEVVVKAMEALASLHRRHIRPS